MISKAKIKLIKSLEYKKYRDKEGLFIAEGHKVVEEMKKAYRCIETYDEEDDVRKITFLQHPQGVVGIFEKPELDIDITSIDNTKLYLALDKIQDPGNLGTIIRVADWFGIDTIFCSADTVDCWSPKVVQATMGSLARVKVVYCDLSELIDNCNIPVFGTFLDGHNIYNEQLPANGIIVMGNEGNGISEALRSKISHRLLIPATRAGAESLNVAVATAITLSEFRRNSEVKP
ncbi:MAG: RNA methyltransferase [Prevotellaceae bacterium]|nr:RNA methyltransferase [Prevotellaceae bacterium]